MRAQPHKPADHRDEPLDRRLDWQAAVPLLTNRFVLYDSVRAIAISGGLFFALTAGIFALQGEPGLALEMLPLLGIALAAIVALLAVSAFVVMGNRWHVRFTIDSRGVHWVQLRPPRIGLLAALAAQSGHPTAHSAARLVRIGDSGALPWREISRFREHPDAGVISLMNRWRVVLRLYCDASDYVRSSRRSRAVD